MSKELCMGFFRFFAIPLGDYIHEYSTKKPSRVPIETLWDSTVGKTHSDSTVSHGFPLVTMQSQ